AIRPTRPPRQLLHRPTAVGLESLLQDAAKGVLSRSEKWGLNQAVRDAMGNLRGVSPGTSPAASPGPGRRRGTGSVGRYATLDDAADVGEGRLVDAPRNEAQMQAMLKRMQELEERNKALASLLETEVARLWDLQAKIAETAEGSEMAFALASSVGRVQVLQVCLADGTIPLPDSAHENPVKETKEQLQQAEPSGQAVAADDKLTTGIQVLSERPKIADPPKSHPAQFPPLTNPSIPHPATPTVSTQPTPNPAISSTARDTLFAPASLPARPESFIAASPFLSPHLSTSSRRRNQASAFLFGEDADGNVGDENKATKEKKGGTGGKGGGTGGGTGGVKDAEEKEEVIGMGYLGSAERGDQEGG
ncbi:hypothetical protein P152DRAFT_490730, partial [Eremomyces bilateralis CBS 781.70]